jgi:hypothetical protein
MMEVRVPNLDMVFPQLQRLLLVLFLVCVGLIWIKSLSTLTTDADTSYPESALVQTARLASQSGRLYPAIDAPPYTPAPYGPLFYLLLAGAGRVCKGDAFEIRLLLRSIVFASYVVVGLVGYLLARNAGASRNAAALGTAAIWAAPQLWMFWNVTVRPDFPGLLLCLAGIWVISRRASPAFGAVILSGVCCAGGVLIKQSFVAAPLAIALLFILRRSFRNFAVFAASGLLVGLSVIGYLTLRGEPVIREILVISHSPLSVHSGASVLYSTLSVGLAVLVVAGGVAGFLSALGLTNHWQLHLLACYFAAALLVASLTLLNVGRNAYYLFEFWSIASVLSISVVPQAEALWGAVSQPIRIGAAVGLFLLASRSILEIRHPVQLVTEYNFGRLHDLHILSEDPSLTVRSKDPELLDPFLTTILERQHLWTASGILDEISHEQFDVVFTNRKENQRLSLAVLQSLANYYQPLCRTSTMLVMRPKNRPVRFSLSDASYTLREACE